IALPPATRHIRKRVKAFARVFALAPDCHTTGRYSRVWQRHFYDGLQATLPSVVLPVAVDFGWARPPAAATLGPSRDRDTTSERLWNQIRTAHAERGLDAVISYCFSSDVDPALIEHTVELGIPWINFFCDSTYAFDLVEALGRVASLNWFPELAADARYRALGRPVLCRPYAVHPAALPEASCETAEHALGFVGAPTGNCVHPLARLRLLLSDPTQRGRRARLRRGARSADLPPFGRGSVIGAPQPAPSSGRARDGTGGAAARAGRAHLGRAAARAGAGLVMRIAVV